MADGCPCSGYAPSRSGRSQGGGRPQMQSERSSSSRSASPSRSFGGNTSVRFPDFTKFGDTMEELNKLEFVEMQNVEDDLRDFHMKRRKLVFNICSLNLSKGKKSLKKAVSKMEL